MLKKIPLLPSIIKNIIFLLYNSCIPPSANIGSGTIFAYGAIGVVVHTDAIIGKNCVIGQSVTIGAKEAYISNEKHMCPVIGDNCYLAAGAKLLGGISIGSSCQIGAGSIVLSSLPDNSIVVGAPARIIGNTDKNFLAIRN